VTRNSVVSPASLLLAFVTLVARANAQTPAPPNAAAPTTTAPTTTAPTSPTSPEAIAADGAPSSFEDRIARELGVEGGLTSEDVARQAVATSYALEASRAEVAAAGAEVDRAFAAYLPQLSLLARYTRLSDVGTGSAGSLVSAPGVPAGPIPEGTPLVNVPLRFESPLNNYLLQASVTIPISDYFLRVSKGHDSAKEAENASRRDLATTEQAAVADAKTTYYSWVRARLNVIVSQHALEDSRAHLADVQNALQAGTASKADVLQIESRMADSERLVQSAQNLVTELEEQLRILRHDQPTASYVVGEDLATEPPLDLPERHADLVQLALSRRPELDAFRLRANAVERRASIERAGYGPRLDVFGNAYYENPSRRVFPQTDEFTGSWDAGVQVSWVLSDIPAAAASAASFTANAASLRAQQRSTEDRVRREVTAAHTALLDARAAIRTSARSLAAAEESYRVRRVLFQNGRATSVELLDAELELTRARLIAVSARIDLRVARVRLGYAVGRQTAPPARGS
jgi:outer membrane protein